MKRRTFIASVTTATAALGGCVGAGTYVQEQVGAEGGETPGEGTVTTAVPGDQLIEIRNDAFVPQVAEVPVGALVRWANHDAHEHEVQSGKFHDAATAWEFSSGVLGERDVVAYRFDAEGVYEYYCSIRGRGTTCGVVLVGDVELSGSLPCE